MSQAGLGFRAHSGWAALIAVAGPPLEPMVVLRRRVELSRRTPRQPFHAAENRPFPAAEALIGRATEEATSLAAQAIQQAIAELRAAGHEPVAAGLLLAAGRPLPGLREVLASMPSSIPRRVSSSVTCSARRVAASGFASSR